MNKWMMFLMVAMLGSMASADYLGVWQMNDNLTFPANVRDPNSVTVAADGDAAPTYLVYEDLDDPNLLSGSMAKQNDTDTLGFYTKQIALTAANGFAPGQCYTIYMTCEVSDRVWTDVHTFQIGSPTMHPTLISYAVSAVSGRRLTVTCTSGGGVVANIFRDCMVVVQDTSATDKVCAVRRVKSHTADSSGSFYLYMDRSITEFTVAAGDRIVILPAVLEPEKRPGVPTLR